VSVFGATNAISRWDEVSYEICTASAPVNQPPVAEAGEGFEALQGTWVQLDGSASHDPEGEVLGFFWRQVEGPRAQLSDPGAAQPCFTVPQGVDQSSLVFELVVSDGELQSAPDRVLVLLHAKAPDEDLAPLIEALQNADLDHGQAAKLLRLLEEALASNDCAEKLALLEEALTTLDKLARKELDPALAASLRTQLEDLIDAVGPCTTSCREDGGIEGNNLSQSARISEHSSGEVPLTCTGCGGPEAAIDGDDHSFWAAEGTGHQMVIDLLAKQKIKGMRVISPMPQSYRIEIYDNLTLAWQTVAERQDADRENIEDICDVAARYVRFTNLSTSGADKTLLAELQIYGDRIRQPKTVWLGADEA
ncbi:MAG: discoidin domain-containing protein, partial [Deltaproteobacteria bacterium]|nr:discoidin domain-containing protein [Deltaproteobacteria bacterium]